MAAKLGVPVVSDFRPTDLALGGQGAPLVPLLDYVAFHHPTRNRVLQNLGGIANLTVIPARASPEAIFAFDTGPANMVIDALMAECFGKKYDGQGATARRGHVLESVLERDLRERFFQAAPPKSAGREQFGREFVARFLADCRKQSKQPEDAVATATALTAATIAMAVVPYRPAELIASGGGVHNPQIMGHLAAFLPGVAISTSTDHGIDADAKEAIAFAVLAHETWRGRPSNLPSATGARHAVVLGSVTRAVIRQ